MSTRLAFDHFEVDLRRRLLTRNGRPVRIQPQPFALLEALMSRAGENVTRAELQQALWPGDTHVAFETGLNTAVRKLRRALAESAAAPRFVLTVPGIGYRFIAVVTPVVTVPVAPVTPRVPVQRTAESRPAVSSRFPVIRPMSSRLRAAALGLALLATTMTAPGERPDEPQERWLPHVTQARAHIAAGDLRGAAIAFERAVIAGADDEAVFVDYACALAGMKESDAALRVIERGLERRPWSVTLRANRGLRLHAVRRYDEELAALSDAVALDPGSAVAQFHLGLGFARRSQYQASLVALERAVDLSGGAAYYLSWLGRIAADAGDREKARTILEILRQKAAAVPVAPSLIDAVAYHLSAASRS